MYLGATAPGNEDETIIVVEGETQEKTKDIVHDDNEEMEEIPTKKSIDISD